MQNSNEVNVKVITQFHRIWNHPIYKEQQQIPLILLILPQKMTNEILQWIFEKNKKIKMERLKCVSNFERDTCPHADTNSKFRFFFAATMRCVCREKNEDFEKSYYMTRVNWFWVGQK